MMAFTISRRYIRLRESLEDLTLIDMNDVIQEWMEAYRVAIIAEAVAIERRNSKLMR
jgi:hypothetical protein